MKSTYHHLRRHTGFSLTELLVVILIISVLATLGFMLMTKLKKRAEAANQTAILRQVGPLLMLHASESGGYLPAPQGKSFDANGKKVTVHWHQALHGLMRPELDMDEVKGYRFWENSDPLIKNPLYKEPVGNLKLQPWCPGYGMNWEWVNNLKVPVAYDQGDWQGNKPLPVSIIEDPARMPMIAPAPDYHFSTIKGGDKNLEQFLINKQIPLLFLDGHIESIQPADYEKRKLNKQPIQ